MTSTDLVARVVQILEMSGYSAQPVPMTIGPVDHDFPAVLLGHDRSLDLVVVVDTLQDGDELGLRQKIRGLAYALDLIRSRRSFSVVVAGPRLGPETAAAVGRVARVLNVGASVGSKDDESLQESLAVLLPLRLPVALSGPADPLDLLARKLGDQEHAAYVRSLLKAAATPAGAGAVSGVLKREIVRLLDGGYEESS